MTQSHLLEQAKQGDPQAIAALMNKSLQPKGMTAHVERQGDHLEVLLEADRIPNRQALTAFVEQGIHNLGVETIKSVTVSGQQIGAATSAWTQQLYLDPLVPGFEPEELSLSGIDTGIDSDFDPEDSSSFRSASSDLTHLQDLLSDQSEQSFADPQRQELESRLESLWVEQSEDQHQDFLAELMAEEPQDATRQFEEFLAEQPDDRFQSMEQEGLWNGATAPEADDLLADLNLEDSRQALTDQLQEDSGWQDMAEEPDDEPDEILFNFLEDQPQIPDSLSVDETGEPIDEADEILPDFLDRTSDSDSSQFQTQSLQQPIDFLGELPEESEGLGDEGQESPAGLYANPSEEELLDFLAAEEEQDQDLLLELTGDQPDASQWNDETGQVEEFSFNSSPDPLDELSLGVEEEPASSPQADFSAGEYSEGPTDSTSASWEHPPIEFLQAEPEPPSPEMPTEQFDAPMDFMTEPSLDQSDRLADFPPDFLQESPADQSHELFVEPQTNPFIEQMEDQDRERPQRSEDKPSEELNQFDQSEWLLEDTDPDLQPQANQAQYSESQSSPESQYAGDADPLSDAALIHFFEEDAELANTESSFSGDTDEFSEYRTRPDNPDTPVYSSEDTDLILDEETSLYDLNNDDFNDRPDQPEYSFDLDLEPDQPESSGYYADTDIPHTQYPVTEIPNPDYSNSDYSDSQDYRDSQIVDTELPAYQEPSPEELEQQVAELYPEEGNYGGSRPISAEVVEAPSDSRGSPWLFPLILLGISGWIVGLISFAFLWSRLSSPPPENASTTPADVAASPTAVPTACPPTTEAVGNVPIALSELQFQQNASNPQQVNLTGCVTNRTQQPVDIVSIGYRSGTASASTVGGLNFSTGGIIQPGQTVPFTSKFTLPSDTTDLSINTLYWQSAGQTTSKEAATSIKLNR